MVFHVYFYLLLPSTTIIIMMLFGDDAGWYSDGGCDDGVCKALIFFIAYLEFLLWAENQNGNNVIRNVLTLTVLVTCVRDSRFIFIICIGMAKENDATCWEFMLCVCDKFITYYCVGCDGEGRWCIHGGNAILWIVMLLVWLICFIEFLQ